MRLKKLTPLAGKWNIAVVSVTSLAFDFFWHVDLAWQILWYWHLAATGS